ncbi:MAG: helix-turn-helix domain-containing protein [Pseudomonadota bacterium]
MMSIAIACCGFSILAGTTMIIAYLFNPMFPKSPLGVLAGIGLTVALAVIQVQQLTYLLGGATDSPMHQFIFQLALFSAPGLFFLFGRGIVLVQAPFRPWLLLNLCPIGLLLLPMPIALTLLLSIGAAYALWLSRLTYSLRQQRPQYRFEFLFSVVITLTATLVLILGTVLPVMDPIYFHTLYACSIAIAYLLVMFALIAIPTFVTDLFELTRVRYSTTTLGQIDVSASLARLEQLMESERLYEQEDLSLRTCADAMSLSTHQLSELINQHLDCNFTQYVRRHRISAAQRALVEHPDDAILTVALATGFRSQSTFYAAFKAETDMSPGDYRKQYG